MSLLTQQIVREWLPDAADRPALLSQAIVQAEALAARHCGYALALTSYDEYLNVARRMNTVLTAACPIVSITAVTSSPLASPQTLVEDTDYTVDYTQGILRRLSPAQVYRLGALEPVPGHWPCGPSALRVQYTAGWSAASLNAGGPLLPLIQLVSWVLNSVGDVGTTQDSLDGYNRTKEPLVNGIPASIASMLRPYRREF